MATKKHMAPPQPDARERLLNSALTLFTQRGYAAASVREICTSAGVTKPVLYYYFGSKEGLYLHLMEGTYALFESRVARITTFPGDVRQRIIHFCEVVFDISIEQLLVVRLMYSIYYGAPQGAPAFDLEKYYDRMLEVIAGLVQEGIAQGEIKPGNVNDMVWAVLSCLSIAMEEQLCHLQPRLDRTSMTRMLNIVFDGMAAKLD